VRRGIASLAAALLGGLALVPLSTGGSGGTYPLQARVSWRGTSAQCGGTYRPTVICYGHPGNALPVPGLGDVSQSYVYPVETEPGPACPGFHVLGYPARLIVRDKGEISLSVGPAEGCLQGPPSDTVLGPTQPFTITGGTGVYAGASGSGVVRRTAISRQLNGHGAATDIWEGTMVVPNLEFDLQPPSISGAGAKVVRAPRKVKSVVVRYQLAATDNVDGRVPVACQPRSGSRFKVGRRTVVRCSATDKSANTTQASFTVTVTRGR